MGIGPSVAEFLRGADDERLTKLMAEAYRLDPSRAERVFADAKRRFLEGDDMFPPRLAAIAGETSAPAAAAAAAVDAAASAIALDASVPPASAPTGALADTTRRDDGKNPMNALWAFEGHRLRDLRPARANPSHSASQSIGVDVGDGDSAAAAAVPEVDEDGHAILYGSCGRDKRYARCSVCYFRGLRCNTGHYCACCQRPVCIRPRKYPGEEHPKICWNVLHMDAAMLQRVEKKKKRKLQAAAGVVAGAALGSGAEAPALSAGTVLRLQDLHTGHDRQEPLPAELDADARPPHLSDALSTASVAL